MVKHEHGTPKIQDTEPQLEQLSKVSTSGKEPWVDIALSDKERFNAYKKFVDERLANIRAAYDRADDALKLVIEKAPETWAWINEGTR